MSTAEMLSIGNRREQAGEYFNWLADSGFDLGFEHIGEVADAVQSNIYGHIVASNLEYFRTTDTAPEVAAAAARVLCGVTRASARMYWQDRQGARSPKLHLNSHFQTSLTELQANMAQGVIAPLPEEYAMTADEGLQQVRFADKILYDLGPLGRRLLSDANYSLYFSQRTMANGEQLLDTTIDEVVESDGEEQMPHLTRTNFAIGQLLAGIARHRRGRLTIIDNGAGTGATLAATVSAMNQVSDYKGTAIHAVESNADFCEGLEELAVSVVRKIQAINPAFGLMTDQRQVAEGSGLVVAHQDVTDFINNLEALPKGKTDVTVMAANYVWHRLPIRAKGSMIRQIDASSSNSIFLIADLAQNASLVNRRYFNFGNNGPLNCGNISLWNSFYRHGFKVTRLGRGHGPTSIHPKLVERISAEATNDGYLWIAYKGPEAERLMAAA